MSVNSVFLFKNGGGGGGGGRRGGGSSDPAVPPLDPRGGGGGGTLIFSHILRLGPFFGVQNSEFQYFLGF